ncbi:MAG: hypothetical protein KAR87_01755 [Candidatus Aenigmarchaeota archaeon]|nr:hypothetical protein [Candidatus Aenigmarchaeota archaeon]
MSKNALELHNKDSEIASKIFGDYVIDENILLNVRTDMGNTGVNIFSKIKSLFMKK